MAFPWLSLVVLVGAGVSRFFVPLPPNPQPLPAVAQATPVRPELAAAAGHPIVLGDRVLLRTSQGDLTVVLFPAEAPTFTRHFLQEVNWGTFRNEGFWRTEPGYVRLGGPDTDVDTGSNTFAYNLMAHSFDSNSLPKLTGALVMNRRFENADEGGFVRNEYAIIARDGGDYPGTVIGQVVDGLDVLARLNSHEALTLAVDLDATGVSAASDSAAP